MHHSHQHALGHVLYIRFAPPKLVHALRSASPAFLTLTAMLNALCCCKKKHARPADLSLIPSKGMLDHQRNSGIPAMYTHALLGVHYNRNLRQSAYLKEAFLGSIDGLLELFFNVV